MNARFPLISPPEPIAIVGIGCRLPGGGNDPDSFWRLLRDGVDAISEIPADRWDPAVFYDREPGKPGKTNTHRGAFIEKVDHFDAAFFGISPREAARMDPQQRLLMEVAWEALEDAGVVLERVAASNTSVFVGISSYDYMSLQAASAAYTDIDVYSNTGGALSIAANRISYFFNFKGPSASVDTACSSGLVGLHLACQSIWHENCVMALAGGVNLLLAPNGFIGFSRLSMLSPDGRCAAFDARANGFVRAEGAGMVVLKPLARALADNDRIYALVRATGVNQDGRTPGMTVPSQEAQAELVRDCCRLAGIDPATIQYVEAHGTGTQVGDPIEARALGTTLSPGRSPTQPCILGSVKTNIGHLEPASGIAGLIKLALSLHHRQIPANLHFNEPNPNIPFAELGLRVPRILEPWPQTGDALAGINSFGFGGTNAHAILQGVAVDGHLANGRHKSLVHTNGWHPVSGNGSDGGADCYLLPLSGRGAEGLKATTLTYKQFVGSGGTGESIALADLCANVSLRRSQHSHRLAIVTHSRQELLEQLEAFAAEEAHPGVIAGQPAQGDRPGLAFVCAGQGPQWWAMGRQLLAREPAFRAVLSQCDALIRKLGDWSLLEELTAEESTSRLQETSIAQPAIFAIQVALAALWRSWGIVPDAVIGHSVGEVAAGYLAGVLSLEDAVRVIFQRGRCMDFAPGQGKMLAVGLSLDEARRVVAPFADRAGVAAINGPTSLTLSGDGPALEAIADLLTKRNVYCKFLKVQYAFHSYQMDPVQEPLLAALAGLTPSAARLPLFSTVTGQRVDGPEWGADYWWRNVRQEVRFTDAVDRLIETNHLTFVELSPHPVLTGSVSDCLTHRAAKGKVLFSLRRGDEERATMLRALGTLYTLGYPVDWERVAPASDRFVRLPNYPWQHVRYWYESEESHDRRLPVIVHPLLGRSLRMPTPAWANQLELSRFPLLADHRVRGHVVLPGTAYLEMALAAAKLAVEGGGAILEEVQMLKACFLPEDQAQMMQSFFNPSDSSFTVFGRPQLGNAAWTMLARGILRGRPVEAAPAIDLEEIRQRCRVEIDAESCYTRFKNVGLDYGPAFQSLRSIRQGEREALGEIHAPAAVLAELDRYLLHPALLDACVQTIFGLPSLWGRSGDGQGVFLPVEVEQLRVHAPLEGELWCQTRLVEQQRDSIVADLRVFGASGKLLVEIRGLRCQSVGDAGDKAETLDDLLYEYDWQFQPLSGRADANAAGALPQPRDLAPAVQAEAQRLGQQQRVREDYERLEPRRSALCVAWIWNALEGLGADLRPGQHLTMENLAVAPRHQRLLKRFLDILEAERLVRRTAAGDLEIVRSPDCSDTDGAWRSLVAEFPAFIADLMLLGRCGPRLPEILRGEIDPAQLIFTETSLATAEHFYQDSPAQRYTQGLAGFAVARLVSHSPPDRPLRVLEIGAGTGGLTSYILPMLPAGRSCYTFTDPSTNCFAKGEQKFRDCNFIRYQQLDIEIDPAKQGFEKHSFDLILVSQVLHATTDLRQTLAHVRQLLAPGGLLLMVEAMRAPYWADTVFGLLESWWRFGDADLRPTHPLLPFAAWQRLLEETGFSQPTALGQELLDSELILARGPEVTDEPAIVVEPATNVPAEVGRWLLFTDQGGVGAELARLLTSQGERCTIVRAGDHFERTAEGHYVLPPASLADLRRLLERELAAEVPSWRGLVHLWNLDAPTGDDVNLGTLDAAQAPGCLSVVNLLQAWSDHTGNPSPRLSLVTRGVFTLNGDNSPTSLAQSPLWGLGRVAASEYPHLRIKLIDLGSLSQDRVGESRSLYNELRAIGDREDEVALRGPARFVHRFQRRPMDRPSRPGTPTDESYRLHVARSGTIDGLKLRAIPRREPGPGEIEIKVHAAALNFSDVMKALGLYPGLPDGPVPLGLECSGTIVAVGPDVEGFRVNDDVAAISPCSFSAYVTIPALMAVPKPTRLTFEEAATIPIAFLTADYALNYMGRMEQGERVLIHSATGGVGLAAMQLARRGGAEIFATAGSREKRELLHALGVEHVMDSRTVAFADEIRERTGGRGVDLVLNSLAGEAISKGLSCLGQHGRFLEIGKRDIYQNSRLGLLPFRKNLSFMAIDLDRGMRDRPVRISALFRDLAKEFERGTLTPLPHRVFPIANVAAAFRHMAQGKHLGKVILSFRDCAVAVAGSSDSGTIFRADGTYLISGGLSGFGLATAQWLVENGAKHLVLVSRRGIAEPDVQPTLDAMKQAGVSVRIARADVSKADDVTALMADITGTVPPVRGVFHAAMVLDDCVILNLNEQRWRRAVEPKMHGAWNLHVATKHLPLDCFVLFSTMSAVFGFPGQANYAAGNAFLDALAHHRRSQGLPAVAVNWGYLGKVGYVARNEKIGEGFKQLGLFSFTPEEALSLLGRLLRQESCQVGVLRVNWRQQRKMFRAEVSPKFAQLYEAIGSDTAATADGSSGLDGFPDSPEERKERLLSLLRNKVARVLGAPANGLNLDKPLTELGLDSLMAVELRNWVEGELRLSLPIVELMRGPSVTALVDVLRKQLAAGEGGRSEPTVEKKPVIADAGPAPLSVGQRALWFVEKLAPGDTVYNLADAVRLRGSLNIEAMTRAFQTLIDRHPALRTIFLEVEGRPFQKVQPTMEVPFEIRDASDWTAADLRECLLTESQKPFDLEKGPTVRVVLWRIGDEEHILLFMVHHLLTDLASLVLCIREFLALYEAEKRGLRGSEVLPALTATYADFVRWQTELLAGAEGERMRSYWLRHLAGELPVLNLPVDHPRPAVQTYRGAWQSRTLSRELTRAILDLSKARGTTPFMTLLTAYLVLLHRYTGQADILVACPTFGRSRPEFASVVGYFVNPVVIRGDLSRDLPFTELLEQTRQTILGAFGHQDYPFALLVEQLQPRRDPARSPLFQTMFDIRKAPWLHEGGLTDFMMEQSTARRTVGGLNAEAIDLEDRDAQFDLSMQLAEVDGCLMAGMQFNTDLFEPSTIERWLLHWETLLEGLIAAPVRRISELPFVPAAERSHLLMLADGPSSDFPQTECIHHLFEKQAAIHPEAVALVHENEQLTFGELNHRANQLAHRLRRLGIGPDVLVGLSVERSLDMVVGVLGILKAGGAYLPLDPTYPEERLRFMLRDARVPVLLTRHGGRDRFADLVPNVLCTDTDETLKNERRANPERVNDPENLAYTIYTSGSTGQPRGVLIRHRAVVNHNVDFVRRYGLEPGDRVLQFASISFDTAAEELFPALLAGATVVLRSDEATISLEDFLRWVGEQRLTIVDLPTSYWHFWVSELTRTTLPWPDSLRWVIVGGEKVLPDRLAAWQRLVGERVNWSNGYGPTEATIQATTFSLISRPETARAPAGDAPDMRPAAEQRATDKVPIGRPIANVVVYLLDTYRQPVPIGVPGEIWIGGIGLARGYLNQPELTAERFATLTIRPDQPERLYRTGDLARWQTDGNLEYLGRIDHQVKIRGYRIELPEIEARLTEHPQVAENLVLARTDSPGEPRLVAYVVGKPDQTPTVAGLREFLKQRLPGYMVPAVFVLLDKLPMTPNGKLDRNALPVPTAAEEREFVAPRTTDEKTLAAVWVEVLNVGQVGVTDNFFDMGGDSIRSLQMISRARQAGLHLTPSQIYKHQNIADLLATRSSTPVPASVAVAAEEGAAVPLTPIQHWFFEQNPSDLDGWSQALQFDLDWLPELALVEKISQLFAARHDALRLRFRRVDGNWMQTIGPVEGSLSCRQIDVSGVPATEQEAAAAAAVDNLQSRLNVEFGPLAGAALIERGPDRPGRLVLVVHHLAMDSVSWRVLLQEFLAALLQLQEEQEVILPPVPTSFRHYATRLTGLARTTAMEDDAAFWIEEGERTRKVKLPLDHATGVNSRESSDSVWMTLDESATQLLLSQTGRASATPTEAALAVSLARVLAQWSGASAMLLDLEGHGRDGLEADLDLSQTVGWLASIHPLWLEWPPDASGAEVLGRIARQIRESPVPGISYGVVRYLGDAQTVAVLAAQPQAEVRLNYIGQLDVTPGLADAIAPMHRETQHLHRISGTRRYVLECNSHVAEGRLWLGLTYSRNLHERRTIEKLAGEILAELSELFSRVQVCPESTLRRKS